MKSANRIGSDEVSALTSIESVNSQIYKKVSSQLTDYANHLIK